ncbi:glycine betaine ABC transporter substrate-binding protein [Streptomyces ipomoeae]|nr:glycine betaine ABC transporter substrate-binding protein [Streptomyces ipomoeae]MDX2932178.1 glycine betaine ABC transporter substrate-binding protein [Streptomyces ipomoeae]
MWGTRTSGVRGACVPGVCPPRRREGPRDRRAVRRPGTTTRAPPPRSLKRAYAKKEPIAVTLWSPHWAYSDYALPPELSHDPSGHSPGRATCGAPWHR